LFALSEDIREIVWLIIFSFLLLRVVLGLLVLAQVFLRSKEVRHIKRTPYESGFLSSNKSGGQFSLQFFMTLIIFMLFDLEVVLILPLLFAPSLVLGFLLVGIIFSL
jgi:NADH-quinone oxidoreductase subunit A